LKYIDFEVELGVVVVNLEVVGLAPGLPDGIFSNQTSQFGQILVCLAKKDVSKFYSHLIYFTAIPYILGPFVIFCGHFGIFFPFW
jgi:hypothetical protein